MLSISSRDSPRVSAAPNICPEGRDLRSLPAGCSACLRSVMSSDMPGGIESPSLERMGNSWSQYLPGPSLAVRVSNNEEALAACRVSRSWQRRSRLHPWGKDRSRSSQQFFLRIATTSHPRVQAHKSQILRVLYKIDGNVAKMEARKVLCFTDLLLDRLRSETSRMWALKSVWSGSRMATTVSSTGNSLPSFRIAETSMRVPSIGPSPVAWKCASALADGLRAC